MKRLVLIFLIAFLPLCVCFGPAFAYELQTLANIPLADRSTGISVNTVTGIAAVVTETKKLYLIDTNSSSIARTVSLDKVPSAVAIDEKTNAAIVSSKDGTLSFFTLDSGSLIKTITTTKVVYSAVIDTNNRALYLGTGDGITIMDLESGATIKEIQLPNKVISLGMDSSLGCLVIVVEGKDGIVLYDAGTLEPMDEMKTGGSPSGAGVNPSTNIAVLTNPLSNSISLVSLESRDVIDTEPFNQPGPVAIDPTRNIALIGTKDGITVVQLENPIPSIVSLIPENSSAGSPSLTLSIKGSKFVRDSLARFDLRELDTLFEDNSNLKAIVPSDELSYSRDVPVTVINPQPGGGMSNSVIFQVINPVPRAESLQPDAIALSNPPARMRIRGSNFLPSSVVNLSGKNLITKFISSILLEAQLDLTDVKTPASYPVTVINPRPVSLASNVVFLNIVADETGLSSLEEPDTRKEESVKTTGTLKGRILNTQKQPIEGVSVRIKNIRTETDSDGYFILNNVPSGKRHLMIHGETAKKKDKHHPTIPLTVNIEADKVNEMPFQIYLHEQKNRNFKDINNSEVSVLSDPEVPGFELRIPKGVKITGWDGVPNQKISVRTVPTDRLPVKPLPQNSFVRTVYMFYFDKVGGGIPDQPIPIKVPNDLGLLPGQKAVLWYYDESPNEGEAPNDWAIAGTGTVTPDGRHIVSDPGVGVPKFCCGAIAMGGAPGGGGPGGPPGGGDDGCHGGKCCTEGGGGSGSGPGGNGGGGDGGLGSGAGGPQISGTAGDPVDLATGSFIHAKEDLYIPGIIPVSISRYYRSGDNSIGTFGKSTYFEYDWVVWSYGANGQINNTNPTMLLLVKPGNYQYRFAVQSDGTFVNATDPAMRGAVFTKNTDNTMNLRMKDGWTSKFDVNGRLIEISDRNGNRLTLTRHDDFEGGYLESITTPEGRTITFSQDYACCFPPDNLGFFKTNSITDSSGRTLTYTYETDPLNYFPRLKTVAYPDGSSIQYQYDSAGRMSGLVNERGVLEVFNEYDSNNRVIRQTHSDGGTYTFNYTAAGGYIAETSMTAPNSAVTTWRFNSNAYITDKTVPDGTTTYEREPGTNKILSVTDPMNRAMTYTYDAKGNVLTLTDNATNTTTYEYEDTYSRITSRTDPLGNVTTMTYDSVGNLSTLSSPDNKTTTFTYNSIGKPLTVTDAASNVTTMEYDTSGNLTKVTDALGSFSTMTYDNLSRLSTTTDANGNSTNYIYDIMGRTEIVTDPLGNITQYSYGLDGKLYLVTDAKSHDISYHYDSRGRLIKMTDQVGNTETYTYNTSDNLTSVTDRKGQTTTYTYDLMNRLTRADYADDSYTSYTYDAVGKVLTITDSVSGTISYTYTGTGCGSGCTMVPDKVASETTSLGSVSYTYDAIGRRTSMTVTGQPAVNYGYDAGGRLNDINTLISGIDKHFTITYDDLGRRASLILPNGVTTNYTYDNGSRLLNLTHLNSLNVELEVLNYQYDAVGNRISMNRPSVNLPLTNAVTSTSYNEANQMLTFDTKNMTYDNNGNLTSVTNSCGTTTYTRDVRNRLVGITGFKPDCSALSASFTYDAVGRRIEKTVNGGMTQYVYDGLDILQEIENGLPSVNYIRTLNIDEPLSRIKADGSVRYYQQDALGSIVALTDENGVVRTTYTYGPFGNTTITGEASDNPFQYTGRENDGTGLYYYRARYYSPELQRFISEDPIGLNGGDIDFYAYVDSVGKPPTETNLYLYTGNSPVNRRDPSGKAWWTDPVIELIDWLIYLGHPPKSCKDPGECNLSGESHDGNHTTCRYDCDDGSRAIVEMPDNRSCRPVWNTKMKPYPY